MDRLAVVIKNTYLHTFEALKPLFDLVAQVDPTNILQHFGATQALRELRNALVVKYSWAVPSTAAIRLIAQYSPILEVGAGTGYWAYLLGLAGADVVAYDAYPRLPVDMDGGAEEPFFDVRQGTAADAVAAHPERTLLLCWPSAGGDWTHEALSLTRARHVVFIGWKDDDVTGSMEFHDRLARDWELVEQLDIPQWPDKRDRLYVYRRPSSR